eukprot:COSAG02_NODE_1882_length_10539_cov_56.252203_3_plen_1220_part_00
MCYVNPRRLSTYVSPADVARAGDDGGECVLSGDQRGTGGGEVRPAAPFLTDRLLALIPCVVCCSLFLATRRLDRLTKTKSSNQQKETHRRAQILQLTPLLSQLPLKALRQMAAEMDEVAYTDGTFLFHEGEMGDAMYVVESGSLAVYIEGKGKVKEIGPGETCGELALINNEARTASIKAQGKTELLKLGVGPCQSILKKAWGGQKELERRATILLTVPLFATLPRDELHMLSAKMTRVSYTETGVDIVTEGKMGDCMYVVEQGSPMVWVQAVGRVAELKPGDYFGEMAVLNHLPRTATVRTSGPTVCLRLRQADVLLLMRSGAVSHESRDALDRALERGYDTYGLRHALRGSDLIKASLLQFWDLVVELSEKLVAAKDDHAAKTVTVRSIASAKWEMVRRRAGMGFVNREGYTAMHLRISKVLQHDFTYDDGADSAHADWAEDITAFSGDSKVDIWLEEVKKTLKDATFKTVHAMGWQTLFQDYDADDSGSIDFDEFHQAARNDLHMTEELFPEAHLRSLFNAMDSDGGGEVEYAEFSQWMSETDFSRPASYLSEAEQAKRATVGDKLWEEMSILQIGCRDKVDRLGWRALFAKYDTGGDAADGELDLEEFTDIIRDECNISEEVVPDDILVDLFSAVDIDGQGGIDGEEFENFICSDPLAMDMNYKIFSEAMFQLAQLWVQEEDEVQYAKFLDNLFQCITTEPDNKTIEMRDLDDIETIANPDGNIIVEGVKTKNPFEQHAEPQPQPQPEPEPEPEPKFVQHRGSDLGRSQSKATETASFELTASSSRSKSSGEKKTAPGKWTEAEEKKLLKLVSQLGLGKWQDIANKLGTGRTAPAVSTKYFALINEGKSAEGRKNGPKRQAPGGAGPGKWTEAEEKQLLTLVDQLGLGKWQDVAKTLGTGRTASAVSTKYFALINESKQQAKGGTSPGKWTEREEKQLLKLVSQFGVGKWHHIAKNLGTGRTALAVSVKYFALISELNEVGHKKQGNSPIEKLKVLPIQEQSSKELRKAQPPGSHGSLSPRAPTAPKPEGWFKVFNLGSRDDQRIKLRLKQSHLPPKQSKVPTAAINLGLLSRKTKKRVRLEAASLRADGDGPTTVRVSVGEQKVPVPLKTVVNWASTEDMSTGTALFFSPLEYNVSQSARLYPAGGSDGQHSLLQHPRSAWAGVPGGGGMLVATRRQPLASPGTTLPSGVERRRPDPLQLPSEIGHTQASLTPR